MQRFSRAASGFVTVLLLLGLLLVGAGAPVQLSAQAGMTNFTNLRTSGDITAGDDATVTDDLTVGDDTVLGGDLTLTPGTVRVVTMNGTLTPLSAYQPISSTGTVNTATITVGAAGSELTLVNRAATSIVFSDTGTLKLTGNITLGQFDSLRLISDGTNWIMLGTANN